MYRGQAPGKGASLESNSQPDFDRDLKRTSTIALGNTGHVPLFANPLFAKNWQRTVVCQLFDQKKNFLARNGCLPTFFSRSEKTILDVKFGYKKR